MKGLDNLIRIHEWTLDEKRRKVSDLEGLAERLRNELTMLEANIKSEQSVASGNSEVSGAYGAYAAAAISRRDKLRQSLAALETQIVAAVEEVAAAFREYKKLDTIRERDRNAEEERRKRVQAAELDEAGLQLFRRTRMD